MWRWIAVVTVLVGTFGLGMWSAFCIGAPRASIDVVWEPDASWQRIGVDFDYAQVPTNAPAYHCDQCPASNEPNKICTVEALPCPDQLPEDVQRVIEIARSRPSAAAGTMFDDPSNEVVFVEALTEVAEQSQKTALPIVDDPRVVGDGVKRDPRALHANTRCESSAADDACPLGTSGGCPLVVNDASVCATTTCDQDGCDSLTAQLVASTQPCPPCDETCQATGCAGEACTADVCESTCSEAACAKSSNTASSDTALEVTGFLYERARELDAKAWQLEEAGEYGLADRMREIANEMRNSARVARASAAALR
jgi:hypothetical protein